MAKRGYGVAQICAAVALLLQRRAGHGAYGVSFEAHCATCNHAYMHAAVESAITAGLCPL